MVSIQKVLISILLSIGFIILNAEEIKNVPTRGLESFYTYEIVPDVIDVAPSELLNITYSNNLEVKEGNELTPTQVKVAPTVAWNGEPNTFYTLYMSDPDAPSRAEPLLREWQHWLVGNIPGSDLWNGNVLSSYVAIGPPLDTGLHRYVFLLFKQTFKINFTEPILGNSCRQRDQFSLRNLIRKYNLGDPVAGNFFQGQYDDYSPILQEELGISLIVVGNETVYHCE